MTDDARHVELLRPGQEPTRGRILPLVGFSGSAHDAVRELRHDITPICNLLASDPRLSQQCEDARKGTRFDRDRFLRYAATKLMVGEWFMAVDDPNFKAIHESGVAAAVRFLDPTGLFDAHYARYMEGAGAGLIVGTLVADRFGGKFVPGVIKRPVSRWVEKGMSSIGEFVARLRGKKAVIVRPPPYKYTIPPPRKVGEIFEMDISDLRSRQGFVGEHGRYVPEAGVIPQVYWVDWVDDKVTGNKGFWAIFDGNHRTAEAYRRGLTKVNVEVIDFVPPASQNAGMGGPATWGDNLYKPFLQTQVWKGDKYMGPLEEFFNKPRRF